MFKTSQPTLLGRGRSRISSISHLMPDTSPKARKNAKKAMMRGLDSAWMSTRELRSRRALTWIGGGAAILSALGFGYSYYSKKRRSSGDQEW